MTNRNISDSKHTLKLYRFSYICQIVLVQCFALRKRKKMQYTSNVFPLYFNRNHQNTQPAHLHKTILLLLQTYIVCKSSGIVLHQAA